MNHGFKIILQFLDTHLRGTALIADKSNLLRGKTGKFLVTITFVRARSPLILKALVQYLYLLVKVEACAAI